MDLKSQVIKERNWWNKLGKENHNKIWYMIVLSE